MAVDKVKPLKIESPALGGTQTDPFPVETNPAQDYLAAKGLALDNTDTRLIDTDTNGEASFRDDYQQEQTSFSSLRHSTHFIPIDTACRIKTNRHMLCYGLEIEGQLTIDGALVMV
jgi:hypothetical protein